MKYDSLHLNCCHHDFLPFVQLYLYINLHFVNTMNSLTVETPEAINNVENPISKYFHES